MLKSILKDKTNTKHININCKVNGLFVTKTSYSKLFKWYYSKDIITIYNLENYYYYNLELEKVDN